MNPARAFTWLVIAVHACLLVWSFPDYFADNDLGYHISLARQYGEHGSYFWDKLNYGPSGRPNLQGPLLHYGVGFLGHALGGEGDDYVHAFTVFALLQWAAAVFTAVYFARKYGGDLAGLFAGALLSGGIYSAGSFFVGVPSGWIFILSAWAVFFLLEGKLRLSALATAAAVYVHLGGITTAPFGILLAALITRRWRALVKVGAITALLASPYIFHFLRSLDYWVGRRGHVAGSVNLLLYALAVPAVVWLLRRPRENAMLLCWAAAPLAWFFQDRLRFFLQSSVAGAAAAGVFVAWLLERYAGPRARAGLSVTLVLLATAFPLSIPSLPVEILWASGRGFPRELDWKEAKILAGILRDEGLDNRLLWSYYPSLGCAVAVYTPVWQEGGHWNEVRPQVNPAAKMSAGEKVYLLPMPPGDDILVQYRIYGLIRIHGGTAQTSVVTLTQPGRLDLAAPLAAEVLRREALWLADHAVNNTMPPLGTVLDPAGLEGWRAGMWRQRVRAGRMSLAVLAYAHALEPLDPERARGARNAARDFGTLANFLGDETAMDYISEERFQRFRENLRTVAQHAPVLRRQTLPSPELSDAVERLFREYF
ncbi:MAG: hypothetical protein K6T61_01060 [Bryobacteraceae bacterium]|nr:hypothetical protein [Bryobacteraceae bacterium]